MRRCGDYAPRQRIQRYDPRVMPNAPGNSALEPIRSTIKAFKSPVSLTLCGFASRERNDDRWSTLSNPSEDPRAMNRRYRKMIAGMFIDLDKGF